MDRNRRLYESSKYIVKKWEREFKKTKNCVPTKADIKAAPTKIKDAYKTYWSLKNADLIKLNTSCEIVDENAKDCFNSSSENQDESILSKGNVTVSEESICFQPLSETLNDSQFLLNITNQDSTFNGEVDKPAEDVKKSSEAAFNSFENLFKGKSLEKPIPVNEKTEKENVLKMEAKSLSSQYAEKLFAGSKFKKRNPRKPRNFTRSKTTSCINENEEKGNPTNIASGKALSFAEADIKCSQESSFSAISELSAPIECQDESAFLFNDNFKIVTKETSLQTQAVSLLQKSFNSSASKLSLNRTVDKGWLDRLSDIDNACDRKLNSPQDTEDSGIASFKSESSLTTPSLESVAPKEESEEEIIYDSDCESQSQSFWKFNLLELSRSSSNFNSSYVRNEASSNCFAVKKICPENSENNSNIEKEVKNQVETPIPKKRFLLDTSGSSEQPAKKLRIENISESSFKSSTKPELITALKNQKKKEDAVYDFKEENNEKVNKSKALLEKKMASGAANENFVKINIEKKRYARGKKTMNFSKYKKQKWKQAKKNSGYDGNGILKCFKCGDVGHFSKACPNKVDGLMPLEDYDSSEESPFPSLEEAAEMAKQAADKAHKGGRKFTKSDEDNIPEPDVEDDALRLGALIKPLYNLNPDGSLIETPPEVYEALNELGHSSFRPGQEEGVMRVLSGVSTLVTLSTGSGKSLIYQLPAYIYNKMNPGCITLVISPLVSLMEDQIFCGSKKLRAACLHHNMTQKKREAVLESLRTQNVSILLIAPESMSSWDSARSLFKILPPIAFACVDEAHSISQFSHNFRPSYLTICQVLREKLGIKTFLGLTATASRSTLDTVMSQLGIAEDSGIITDTPLPDNLHLSVSSEENRREALITLLRSEKYKSCQSIIIYCTRREECDSLATFLRAALQENDVPNKKGRLSLHAEAYHAGLTAGRRNQVQSAFMTGKLRIVIATVAFGMGINKNDIRAIIHYNMPYSFESYVQEIGRAGRDRQPAHCHLFLDSKRNDLCELQRHIYADTMERMILRKLLQMIFIPCECHEKKVTNQTSGNNDSSESFDKPTVCTHHENAFPIEETVRTLDLPQEVISTLLAYLELDKKRWIKVLPLAYTKCKIISYKGVKALKDAARNCPPLAVVLAQNLPNNASFVEFDIIQLSRKINWDSGVVKHTLKQLEWTTVNGYPKKSGISVEFSCLGFRVLAPGDLNDEQLDEALNLLHSIVLGQELSRLKQLTMFYDTLKRVSQASVEKCCDADDTKQSDELKSIVRKYFTDKNPLEGVELKPNVIEDESEVIGNIRRLIGMYREETPLNGRAIARILHGIGSPNFPPIVWGRTKFWRLHLDKDFNTLVKLSNKQIIMMK